MDFELSFEQQAIVDSALAVAERYGPDYWHDQERDESFPQAFFDEIAQLGFPGLALPEAYGGSGLGLTESALAMEALCRGGGGGGPALGYLFSALGALTILAHGNDAQKANYLPKLASGEIFAAFGLSEPDAGTNSLNMRTFAERTSEGYAISGNKWFITNIERSAVIMLVARTTRQDEVERRTQGLTMFLVDLPAEGLSYEKTPKHAFNYYQSNSVSLDQVQVRASSVMGEVDQGFYHMLATLNPERVLVAAAAIGTGRLAIAKAVEYAQDRKVFGGPIGAHQAVQHPLAAAYARLETAWLGVLKAATQHDAGKSAKEIGDIANMSKYLAVEACIDAVYHAMQTLGGAGFAREYHIERWWRECQLFRVAPISQQMTLNYLSEHVLGLPRSY